VATFPAGTTGFSDITVINTTNKLSATANKKFYSTFYNTGFTNYDQGVAFAAKNTFTAVNIGNVSGLKSANLYADFNLDGKPDYVHLGTSTTAIIPNTSNLGTISFGTLITLNTGGKGVQSGDIDNDGLLDLITFDGTSVIVYRNTSSIGGTSSFDNPITIALNVHVAPIAVGNVITNACTVPLLKSVINPTWPDVSPGLKIPSKLTSPPSLIPCINSL
jgi:hypothetical protein